VYHPLHGGLIGFSGTRLSPKLKEASHMNKSGSKILVVMGPWIEPGDKDNTKVTVVTKRSVTIIIAATLTGGYHPGWEEAG
jgi:hypothetical protein